MDSVNIDPPEFQKSRAQSPRMPETRNGNAQASIAPPPPAYCNILAVDDSPPILFLLQSIITPLGHQIITASNGAEAIQKFRKESPDLVLMDIMMPDMDGFDATRQIKNIPNNGLWTPVIMLSTLDEPADFAKGLEAGADDYLTKPIDAGLLTTKIRFMQRVIETQRNLIYHMKFQSIFDNVLDGIVTSDDRGAIVTFNQAAEHIFGYQANEVIGHNVSLLMPVTEAHRHDAYMARYRTSGETKIMGVGRELQGKRKDGSLFPIHTGVTEVNWGGMRHFIACITDISERKRSEKFNEETRRRLEQYHKHNEEEKDILSGLMAKIVRRDGLEDPLLTWHIRSTDEFSGDVIAAQRDPQGRLFLLVADATGHGLAAAISLLPVVGIFYAMVDKGLSLPDVIAEMNKRLREMMPVGRFLAACVITVDENNRMVQIWNGGMPSVLLAEEGEATIALRSHHLALGILTPAEFDPQIQQVHWTRPARLVLYSDGLTEAVNERGEMFGMDRLKDALTPCAAISVEHVLEQLNQHMAGRRPHDDISLAIVELR